MDVVEQYLNAWNAHDAMAIEDCFLPEGIYIDSNMNVEVSAHQLSLRATELFISFPNFKVEINERSPNASGLVASRWTILGAFPGLTLSGVDIICIHQEKIQSVQVYFDRDTSKIFAKVPSLHLKYVPESRSLIDSEGVTKLAKYSTSGLSDQELTGISQKVEHLMHAEHRYLDHDLSLSKLADTLQISTNHLSQTINTKFHCNFYQFINDLRINFAKQLIVSNKAPELKVLSISLESGFKSTSTFYAAFKKVTGMTPKEYKMQI
jgi:AraC-like DNA-binding protein